MKTANPQSRAFCCVVLPAMFIAVGGCAVTMLNANDVIILPSAARTPESAAHANYSVGPDDATVTNNADRPTPHDAIALTRVPTSNDAPTDGDQAQVLLCAYLERRIVLSTVGALPGVTVEFRRDGEPIGSAVTDENGCAMLACESPIAPWRYTAHATDEKSDLESQGSVYVWSADRPAVVIDLDETLLQSRYLSMLFWLEDPSPPMTNARDACAQMSKDHEIIYISTRARLFRDMTRTWLNKHDFPPGPIVHTPSFAAVFDQRQAKLEMIRSLLERGVHVVAGIGDKSVDETAFDDNGVLPIIVRPGYRPERADTIVLSDWSDVPASLERRAPRESSAVPMRRAPSVRGDSN